MLTIHHLAQSQSERIVWLCEELGCSYDLVRYEREPATRRAPPDYQRLHPMGVAPVITDGPLVLGESGAIVEYLLSRTTGHGLSPTPSDPAYPDYLFWMHFANGSMVPNVSSARMAPNEFALAMEDRLHRSYAMIEAHLSRFPYFAGTNFTAADIMMVFPLTTMQLRDSVDLSPYPAVTAYLERIAARDAYRRAMLKADSSLPIPRLKT